MLGGLDYHSIASAVRRALWSLLGASSSDGYAIVKDSNNVAGAIFMPPALGFNLVGGYLDWTVAGNVLTCAVKAWSGNDPNATEPVYYPVRDATAATGSLTYRKIVAPLSVSLNNTALIGTVNGIAFRLWACVFNDGGVDRLALINCLSTVAGSGAGRDVVAIYPLAGWGIASAVLSDNAADNSQVFYANAAVASKAYTTLGYATWEAGLAAAGTWSAGPTRKQLYGPAQPLPGQVIQVQRNDSGAVATGTTTIPNDDTIPQSTEGDQYLSQAITPSSAANVLRVDAQFQGAHSVSTSILAALFQDATANALKAFYWPSFANEGILSMRLLAATTSATTLKLRVGSSAAGTFTFNGAAAARVLGGVMNSFIEAAEVMA